MRTLTVSLIALLAVAALAVTARADVPSEINYQGILMDEQGVPLNDTLSIEFKIYPDDTSPDPLWTELHDEVAIDNGLFNVILGNLTPDVFEGAQPYIEIVVEGEIIDPRMPMTSVGYAHQAAISDTARAILWDDIVDIPPGFADGEDDTCGTGGEPDNDWTIMGDDMYASVSGNIGIGTSTPSHKLDVDGVVNSSQSYGLLGEEILSIHNNSVLLGINTASHTPGMRCTFVGHYSGGSNEGAYNTCLGYGAGADNTTGELNTMVGYKAGNHSTDGSENVYIGRGTGLNNVSGSGNVFIGHNAGHDSNESNALYIDNSGTGTPLIYGEFDNDLVTIYGTLGVGTATPEGKAEVLSGSLRTQMCNSWGYPSNHVAVQGSYGDDAEGRLAYYSSFFNGGYHGVYGAASSGGINRGVYGFASGGSDCYGVHGEALSGSGVNYGVYGKNGNSGAFGILGGPDFGVYGDGVASTGVYGTSTSGMAIHGEADSQTGIFGQSVSGVGIHAYSGSNTALYAESSSGLAGRFVGDLVVDGTTTTDVLVIAGGADLSEGFEVRETDARLAPSPGMVVSIDPDHPGDLVVCTRAYDKRVAGVISGAGGIQPGMLMGQKGTEADGGSPVALTGRVYCYADASYGSIEAGDLLTTSDTPGHVMKATDATRSHGAIVGKAMSSLNSGQGLVLVLVNLQ